MAVVFEHEEGTPVGPEDEDGMAAWLEEAEANGWEGEHVFDVETEEPPHPFLAKGDGEDGKD